MAHEVPSIMQLWIRFPSNTSIFKLLVNFKLGCSFTLKTQKDSISECLGFSIFPELFWLGTLHIFHTHTGKVIAESNAVPMLISMFVSKSQGKHGLESKPQFQVPQLPKAVTDLSLLASHVPFSRN